MALMNPNRAFSEAYAEEANVTNTRITGSEILVRSLIEEGVDVVFGMPGGAILHTYDVLLDFPIKNVLCRHEQGATHAAEGYARASGRPGVVMITSGPAATNAITGIADAHTDSCPIVVFTGQVSTDAIGNDAFQEANIIGMTLACTKHSFLVRNTGELARIIKEAFHIARTGRPGPVLIDLPKDVLMGTADYQGYPESVSLRGYNPTQNGHHRQIVKAAERLAAAKRPIIYGGGGIIASGGHQEVKQLAELTQTPVTLTLMGLGGFPASHPLWLGMLGMHGSYAANMAMVEADLIVAIGSRFDDRVTCKLDEFAQHCEIIHIDIDPSNIKKTVRVDIPIVGDVKMVLEKLNQELATMDTDWRALHAPWLVRTAGWQTQRPVSYEPVEGKILPQQAIEEIYQVTRPYDPIVTTGVGQHQMWAAQYFRFETARRFLTSGGLGTMGYGFPAALGAQACYPDRLVIDIDGDGSFQMTSQELATAKQYNLKTKIFIINNQYLGMVRQWQELFFDQRYTQVDLQVQPDLVRLAEAYGVAAFRAEHPAELRPVIEKALAVDGPVLVDIRVEREENVFPMVPAGRGLKDTITDGKSASLGCFPSLRKV
jgi:acetolactate synthase-1/2/3 large subunit